MCFSLGDIVTCCGDGAFHIELVKVRKNLCAKVPINFSPKDAAFLLSV